MESIPSAVADLPMEKSKYAARDTPVRQDGQAASALLASLRLGEKLKRSVMTEDAIAKEIVDAAFRIHTTLGPGLLESVYRSVLVYELERRGLRTVTEQPIPVVYDNVQIATGFRADMVVEDKVIVEIKSVEVLAPVHKSSF
jgi:GxxExxY protein